MKRARVELDILSFWHAGTGRGGGPESDAVACRSPAGLPILPGRTVRGLLRDALELASAIEAVKADAWDPNPAAWSFGTSLDDPKENEDRVSALEEQRFKTRAGNLRVETARLGKTNDEAAAWETWAAANPGEVEHLFRSFASTRVDANGVADDHTLRGIEVTVPLQLYAWVEGPEEPAWIELLAENAYLIRGLGSHRNRGLGRVRLAVEEVR